MRKESFPKSSSSGNSNVDPLSSLLLMYRSRKANSLAFQWNANLVAISGFHTLPIQWWNRWNNGKYLQIVYKAFTSFENVFWLINHKNLLQEKSKASLDATATQINARMNACKQPQLVSALSGNFQWGFDFQLQMKTELIIKTITFIYSRWINILPLCT